MRVLFINMKSSFNKDWKSSKQPRKQIKYRYKFGDDNLAKWDIEKIDEYVHEHAENVEQLNTLKEQNTKKHIAMSMTGSKDDIS